MGTVNKDAASYVNRLGKYLKKKLDGAFKISFGPNHCVVYFKMLYELPDDRESFNEMVFSVDITSYQNKLRINLTEETVMEKTIGQLIIKPEYVSNLEYCKDKLMETLIKAINKEFEGYDFVY